MHLEQFSRFTALCAEDCGVHYQLDGEAVGPKDLADAKGLLPLVVAAVNDLQEQLSGARRSHLAYLEQADASGFLLGWRIKDLPEVPDTAMLLFINYALRQTLAAAPVAGLVNPVAEIEPVNPGPSELRLHLDALGLSRTAASPEINTSPAH